MEKRLGKITRSDFGIGGYDDAQFGWTLRFDLDGLGCGDFEGHWQTRPKNAQWTEEDRRETYGKLMEYIAKTVREAKVKNVSDLVGIPIEVTLENNKMLSWRILTEVL